MAALVASHVAASRWYVVYTLPHREFEAERQLTAQGFRAFLPSHWKTVRHARRFRTVKAAFFPRYLFVELAFGRDRWRSVNGTIGVSHLIMEGERPKPAPPGVVEGLMSFAVTDGTLDFNADLHEGQAVRILSGPFANAIGTLVKLTSSERVQVLLDIMGSSIALSMTTKALAPVA